MAEVNISMYPHYCAPDIFTINGRLADYCDFGDKEDLDPGNRPDYGCGNMSFVIKLPTDEVLVKYNITLKEYSEIVAILSEKMHIGRCAYCA